MVLPVAAFNFGLEALSELCGQHLEGFRASNCSVEMV